MPPAKSLHQLVSDGTFEARRDRHRAKLESEPLVQDGQLAKLQKAYRIEHDSLERLRIARRFERTTKGGRAARGRRGRGQLQAELAKLGPPGSAERRVAFFPRFLRHFDDKPFRLQRWQSEYQLDFHQRDAATGRRVYKIGLLGIPRGNGKTPLAAGNALYDLVDPPEGFRAQIFQVAGALHQAVRGIEFASHWVKPSEDEDDDVVDGRRRRPTGELGQWVRARADRLTSGDGLFRILSSDGRLGHSLTPTSWIVDEHWLLSSYREEQSYVAGESALLKVPDSYLQSITTAGHDLGSHLGIKYSAMLKAPDVRVSKDGCLTIARDPDSGMLMYWYGAPDDADLEDPAIIRACNPGTWLDHAEVLRALKRPGADELEIRRLNFNQWTKTKSSWLPTGAWPACRTDSITSYPPPGTTIWVAVDAAHSFDTTAVAWAWRLEDGRIAVACHVWSLRPEVPCHTAVNDTELDNEKLVEPFIHDLGNTYRVAEVVYDPTYFKTEARHLSERFMTAPVFQQSNERRDQVTEFYKLVVGGRVAHAGDPVLTRHVEAIAGKKLEGGWQISKLNTTQPIDGGVAGISAVGRASLATESAYEDDGHELLVIGGEKTAEQTAKDPEAEQSERLAYDPDFARELRLDVDDDEDDQDDAYDELEDDEEDE